MYADINDILSELGIEGDSDNAILYQFLLSAQSVIDVYTHRTFEAEQDTTRYFDAIRDVDGSLLYLDCDLCQITTVTNGDAQAVTSGQYVTEPRNQTPYHAIRLKSSSGKAWTYTTDPENAIAITGRWSYSVTAPDSIVQVVKSLARRFYHQKDNVGNGDQALSTLDGNIIMPRRLPSDIIEMLKPYVRLV